MKKLCFYLALSALSACAGVQIKNGSQEQLAQIQAECLAAEQEFCPDGAAGSPACPIKSECAKKLDAWEDAGAH